MTTGGPPVSRPATLPSGSKVETLGPQLARHLKIVLDQKLPIDVDSLSDSPAGTPRGWPAPGYGAGGAHRDTGYTGPHPAPTGPTRGRRRDLEALGRERGRDSRPVQALWVWADRGGAAERVYRDGVSRYPALAVAGPADPRRPRLRPRAAGHQPGVPSAAATAERASVGAKQVRGGTGASC